MNAVVADTHAILWFLLGDPRLSPAAAASLRAANRILVSAISVVEIAYLVDKGRFSRAVLDLVLVALDNPANPMTLVPLDRDIVRVVPLISRQAVPDMPDRIIAATAVHYQVPLVSRDGKIQASGIITIW